MLKKVEGIIIGSTPYKESSKIIKLYTKEYGLISVIGKGSNSIKSKLRALTLNFTYGYFYIYYKENSLSTLSNVDIIDPLTNIKQDLLLISYISYLCDLARQVSNELFDEKIFINLIESIKKINNKLDHKIITNIFEIKMLDYLGVGLHLDSCSVCGNKKDIITIDPNHGGFICKNCYKDGFIVDPKTIKTMRLYYYVQISTITKLDIEDKIVNEINTFLTNYYDNYTGLYLKSKDFLNKISPNM